MEGVHWKIGSGNGVKAWLDPWIQMPCSFKPITRNLFLENSLLVADLILEKPRRWNRELLENLFLPRDIELILRVPLCEMASDDRIMWHYTKSSSFTMKLTYKVGW